MGRDFSQHADYSPGTALRIDQEMTAIVTRNYARAREVLATHKRALTRIAKELLIREVLDADQVKQIAKGLPLEDPVAAEAPERPADGAFAAGNRILDKRCRESAVRPVKLGLRTVRTKAGQMVRTSASSPRRLARGAAVQGGHWYSVADDSGSRDMKIERCLDFYEFASHGSSRPDCAFRLVLCGKTWQDSWMDPAGRTR